ncbi:MAG: PfkB family carbohydrate kinase [Haloferacaceae archaeon]
MTDLVTFGESLLRLSPPAGERLATAGRFDAHVGGPESNVAVAAAQFGVESVWLSRLPDTPLGRRVVAGVRAHGVRTGVVWADSEEARVGTYYLERGGAPRGNETRYDRAGTAMEAVAPGDLPLGVVRDAEAVLVSGATPALSDRARETTARLLEAAREAGTTTVFDATHHPELWTTTRAREAYEALFSMVDVLVVPKADAVEVLGTSDRPVELAHGLATAHDFRSVVVARGERGVLGLHDGEVHERPAFDAETCDAAGATDALVAGFLTARLAGEGMAAALDRGAAAAALARTVAGDVLVATPAEVARVVERGAVADGPR